MSAELSSRTLLDGGSLGYSGYLRVSRSVDSGGISELAESKAQSLEKTPSRGGSLRTDQVNE